MEHHHHRAVDHSSNDTFTLATQPTNIHDAGLMTDIQCMTQEDGHPFLNQGAASPIHRRNAAVPRCRLNTPSPMHSCAFTIRHMRSFALCRIHSTSVWSPDLMAFSPACIRQEPFPAGEETRPKTFKPHTEGHGWSSLTALGTGPYVPRELDRLRAPGDERMQSSGSLLV